jgi:hypothetical protein
VEDYNPTQRIEQFKEHRRERFPDRDRTGRLARRSARRDVGIPWDADKRAEGKTSREARKSLHQDRTICRCGVCGCCWFTGCRLPKFGNLRWEHVNLERGLLLPADSKSGGKLIS